MFILVLLFYQSNAQESVILSSSDLPIFIINTVSGIEIPDEPKITAHLGIIHNGEGIRNYLSDANTDYDGQIGIELRGNGSQSADKNSYSFETRTQSGENNNVPLLGFPSENDWILYGPEWDKTLMRNVLAYQLARQMGHYASRTHYCELIVNGVYMGVYVFMEKLKRDAGRINVTEFEDGYTADEGGFILKLDAGFNGNNGWQTTPYDYKDQERKINFQYVYPKPDEISEDQADYIQTYITGFEEALYLANPSNQYDAYADYIDLESLLDLYIINELTKNPDGYRLSTYLHKDAEDIDHRLKFGPVWDYNFGFGNYCCNYYNNTSGWEYDNHWWDYPGMIPFWIDKLPEDPFFMNSLIERWEHWRSTIISCEQFHQRIDDWAEEIDEAKERNFEAWPVLGTDGIWDWNAGETYEDELDYVKDFICARIGWMDMNLSGEPELNNVSIYPNPVEDILNFTYYSEEEESIQYLLFNLDGDVIDYEIFQKNIGYFEKSIHIDYFPSGVYFLKVNSEAAVKFIKY